MKGPKNEHQLTLANFYPKLDFLATKEKRLIPFSKPGEA